MSERSQRATWRRDRLRENVHKGTFVSECSQRVTLGRERSRENVCKGRQGENVHEGMFARGDLQVHCIFLLLPKTWQRAATSKCLDTDKQSLDNREPTVLLNNFRYMYTTASSPTTVKIYVIDCSIKLLLKI